LGKQKQKKKRIPPPAADLPPEDSRAEAVTIAWMLCALFTFCSEVVGLIAKIVLSYQGKLDERQAAWRLLPDITLVMGLATGMICLLLTPLVYRFRKTPPPDSITIVAVLVALAPLGTWLLQWMRG
jgi:hypothetical protein